MLFLHCILFTFLRIVQKSLTAFQPIFIIFFILIELTPPCLGLNVISIYLTRSWNLLKQAVRTALGRLKSNGNKGRYLLKTDAFINLKGAFASGTQTLKKRKMYERKTFSTNFLSFPSPRTRRHPNTQS